MLTHYSGYLSSIRAAWVFEDQASKQALKAFTLKLTSEKAHALGWTFSESDGNIMEQFKALMFASAGNSGDKKIIAAAQEMFAKFIAGDREAIHPNIRGAVFNIALENGGMKEWEAILNEYRTAKQSDERNTALRTLGRSKNPEIIQRVLDLTFKSGGEVRTQDIYLPMAGMRSHKEGIEALWKGMCDNWDMLVEKLPPGLSMLGTVVQICAASFTHEEHAQMIQDFFKGKSTKGFDQGLAQSLDSVRAKSMWLKRDKSDVAEWLKKEGFEA